MKHEERLQSQVCQYLKLQYPHVIFTCEPSGIRVSIGMAKKLAKHRSGKGLPDLMILHPRGDYYHGLMLELKADGTTIFKRNGEVVSNEHIQEQLNVLMRLRSLGYKAEFAVGFNEAKELIDNYLK